MNLRCYHVSRYRYTHMLEHILNRLCSVSLVSARQKSPVTSRRCLWTFGHGLRRHVRRAGRHRQPISGNCFKRERFSIRLTFVRWPAVKCTRSDEVICAAESKAVVILHPAGFFYRHSEERNWFISRRLERKCRARSPFKDTFMKSN